MGKCKTPVGYFVDEKGSKIPTSCKSWNCPDCGKYKRFLVLKRAENGFLELEKAGKKLRFLTLTLGDKARNKDLMYYWNKLRNNLYRQGYRFNYFWIKEYTKKGKMHLHIIIDEYIPQAKIRHCWYLATRKTSFVVYIKIIDGQVMNVAGYMMKYMTKTIMNANFKTGERRYGFSRYKPFSPQKSKADQKYTFVYDPVKLSVVDMWKKYKNDT